jgi:hypothetical protein
VAKIPATSPQPAKKPAGTVSITVTEDYAAVRPAVLAYAAKRSLSEGPAIRAFLIEAFAAGNDGKAGESQPSPAPTEPTKVLDAVAAVRRDLADGQDDVRVTLRLVREDIATAVRALLVTLGKYPPDEVDKVLEAVFPGGPDSTPHA